MGMDIAFSKSKALAAGLVLRIQRTGNDDEIAIVKKHVSPDDQYLAYLESIGTFVEVPGRQYSTRVEDHNDMLIMRANKWGQLYPMMTEWLKAKGIEWTEG